MMLWASGSMHSPHHAPDHYLDKYKGKFDQGWDKTARDDPRESEETRHRAGQHETQRADQRNPGLGFARRRPQETVHAADGGLRGATGVLRRSDRTVIDTLERIGELDNTLIFVTSDNGASGEGGLAGTFNETYVLNGMQTPFDANMRHLDHWGQADTYPHYHAGWAMAGNTPFPYFKQSSHRGGQADALVVHWPNGIKAKGEIRSQYHHISDIAPSILEAAGVEVPAEYHGIPQQPSDRVSR